MPYVTQGAAVITLKVIRSVTGRRYPVIDGFHRFWYNHRDTLGVGLCSWTGARAASSRRPVSQVAQCETRPSALRLQTYYKNISGVSFGSQSQIEW